MNVYGRDGVSDVFDSVGGNDHLYGYGGNDVYWLGYGTGYDVIYEYVDNDGDAGDEIRIKSGINALSVNLFRSNNGRHLDVQLLNDAGDVSDSLRVDGYYVDDSAKVESVVFSDGTVWNQSDFALVRIHGGLGQDLLYGVDDFSDIFDSDAGGNDHLYGYGGNDVYWLGYDTDHDVINEHKSNDGDDGDEIRIKSGINASSVNLFRSNNGRHLEVRLLNDAGDVSDSLLVDSYYTDDSAKVESVVFADGTVWNQSDFALVRIHGGLGQDLLYGVDDFSDIFDSDAGGNDILYGYGGDDVYWLGYGTGHDVILESIYNDGDDGDNIRIKAGINVSSVHLWRNNEGEDLYVQLLNDAGEVSDLLEVANYYTDDSAKVESVVFADGTVWDESDFAAVRIRGGAGDDRLSSRRGLSLSDMFDGDVGGNDSLYGYDGDDVYYLGYGTDYDVIYEYVGNDGDDGDEIRIKSDINASSVNLIRGNNGVHLYVQLLNDAGDVSDSLRVDSYYTDDSAKVESVVFADGTVWNQSDFASARIHGSWTDDVLTGLYDQVDIFDGDAGGNDSLYGYSGNDVYYLGYDTDHDVINEYKSNDGDDGDEIRMGSDINASSVNLLRGNNGMHLYVQLLNDAGDVSDSLRVDSYYTDDSAKVESVVFADGAVWNQSDFASARIHGGLGQDALYGIDNFSDIFDGDAGGNDILYGYGGNDVYWLGYDTDHDVINEYKSNDGDDGDEIRVKSGINASSVSLLRSNNGRHLEVQLLNDAGDVSASLLVNGYYVDDSAKVESVVFSDGAVWDESGFASARIRGGLDDDVLTGLYNQNSILFDIFDGDAGGNDSLYGYSGNDVYWLGHDTDHDVIYEHVSNAGDGGDSIRVKAGITQSDVRLLRSDDSNHLSVQLLDADGAVSDSLRVDNHYTDESAKVESIHANGKVLLANQYQLLIDEMSTFAAGNSRFSDLSSLLNNFWQDEVPLSSGG